MLWWSHVLYTMYCMEFQNKKQCLIKKQQNVRWKIWGVRGKYAITSGMIQRFQPINALHSQLADENVEDWIPIPNATLFNSEKPKVCWIRGHKVCPLIQPTFGSFLNNYDKLVISSMYMFLHVYRLRSWELCIQGRKWRSIRRREWE